MEPVEIAQDKEAAKPPSSPPKRPGDPIIEIAIFPGGRIITYDGRSVIIVVLLDFGGLHVFGNLRRSSGGA
jgi:hypothetical protein